MSTKENKLTGLEIAVIGISCRIPGAGNLDEFWEMLSEGKNTISFFTDDELIESGIDKELLKDKNYVKAKGILGNAEYFDPAFFGYTPSDAKVMDPQTRILHECAWESLEDSGYNPFDYKGSIGLFTGASSNAEWLSRSFLSKDIDVDDYTKSLLSNKDFSSTLISYSLNLRGPSISLSSACSTSLVAVHLACQSLLSGECTMALAGGASIIVPEKTGYYYNPNMMLSPDGFCRAFDENAGGTVFSNGAGMILLKPLEDSMRDHDNIYAVIKGSAINNDGNRKIGYTAPSISGEVSAIKRALYAAQIDSETITYVETHGTGTTLGDPIEIESLTNAFNTKRSNFCAIGSLKSNIGHLDVASGISGCIKTILSIKNKLIPPSLNFSKENPKINFEDSPFYVNTKLKKWEDDINPLRAGISSFGVGGTNAHVIIEEYVGRKAYSAERKYKLVLLSARSSKALESMTDNLASYIKHHKEIDLGDIAYTLSLGRRKYSHSRLIVCSHIDELELALNDKEGVNIKTGCDKSKSNKNIIFMFPGQGSQYIRMGADLYKEEPVFRESLNKCFSILEEYIPIDLNDLLYSDTYKNTEIINETKIVQPILFSFEYSLAQLIMSWGIYPQAMIGHSLGEYVAACISGVFSLEDALKLIAIRSCMMQELPKGKMLSISISEKELEKYLNRNLDIAAINGDERCVISGKEEDVLKVEMKLMKDGYKTTLLKTSHAFHSYMMEPIFEDFKKSLSDVKLNKPRIPYISGLTGNWIKASEATDVDYWCKHTRKTVQFNKGLCNLITNQSSVFIELGPGRTLSTFVNQHENKMNIHSVINLVRSVKEDFDDEYFMLHCMGKMWMNGVNIDWKNFYSFENRYRISLPTYPFERKRYTLPKAFGNEISINSRADILEIQKSEKISEEENISSTEKSVMTFEDDEDKLPKYMQELWEEYFGISPIDIYDNFYDLGGDSLRAMTLISKINKSFNTEIPMSVFLMDPTISATSKNVEKYENKNREGLSVPIEKSEMREVYNISSAQKRMYIINMINKKGLAYNLSLILDIDGKVDKVKINKVFRALINRHEAFRTSFELMGDEIVQRIHEHVEFSIEYKKIAMSNEENINKNISEFIRPFDLSKAPLIRVRLLETNEEKYVLMVDMHHIISDGASMSVLLKEFIALYQERILTKLRIQYKDYAMWQNKKENQDRIEKQGEYWLRKFKDNIPLLNMPLDYNRKEVQTFDGNTIYKNIDIDTSSKINHLSQVTKTTVNTILLSIYNILLSKYCMQDDIVVGITVANRNNDDLQNVIGSFINFLPIRSSVNSNLKVNEFIKSFNNVMRDVYDNQEYPFDKIVEKLSSKIAKGRNPIFDTMLIYHNEMDKNIEINLDGLKFSNRKFKSNTSTIDFKFDIYLENENTFGIYLEYNTDLYKEKTMLDLLDKYESLMKQIVYDDEARISDLNIFTTEELLIKERKNNCNNTILRDGDDKDAQVKNSIDKEEISSNLMIHKSKNDEVDMTVAITSTFTCDPINDYIKWWCNQYKKNIDVKKASYNQVFQELLDKESLVSKNLGLNLILIRFEDWIRNINGNDKEKCLMIKDSYNKLIMALKGLKSRAFNFVGIFPVSEHLELSMEVKSYIENLINDYKYRIKEIPNMEIIDFREIIDIYDIYEVFDIVKDRAGHMPFSDEYYAAMGTEIARKICSMFNNKFKVIALDCDNTLWKGICGEDGYLGVFIDEPYAEFQRFLVDKQNEGMLLVLCSKNNSEDVWKVFDNNNNMILKKDNLSDWMINWDSKSENIRALAEKLNLGIDSFIFIDDSNKECYEMMKNNPEVLTLLLPENSEEIPMYLKHIWAFDKRNVTEEDKLRTKFYQEERQRREIKDSAYSLDEFLNELELNIYINEADDSLKTRISQLTQRTNQFNLSTKRRSEEEINKLLKNPNMICWVLDVIDKFGCYGLTGVIIMEKINNELFIDTFLLSCRILGRGIEKAVLSELYNFAMENEIEKIIADFYPTKKNEMVKEYLIGNNFVNIFENETFTRYEFQVNKNEINVPYVKWHFGEKYEEEKGDNLKSTAADKVNENVNNEDQCLDKDKGMHMAKKSKVIKNEDGNIHKSNKKISVNMNWNFNLNNEENLIHKNYLLALKYSTGNKLKEIPLDETLIRSKGITTKYAVPESTLQMKISEICRKILNVDNVGIDDDFFDLGGHSLKALKLQVELEKVDIFIDIAKIYECRTIRRMAVSISSNHNLHFESNNLEENVIMNDENSSESLEFLKGNESVMILDDIEPFNDIFFKSCFYNSFFPVIHHFKSSEFPLMINDVIMFTNNNEDESFSIGIDYYNISSIENIIGEMGLKYEIKERNNSLTNDIIHALDKKRCIIVWIDCYYESIRRDAYLKKHIPHTLLVFGYNTREETFQIIEHMDEESLTYQKRNIKFNNLNEAYNGFIKNYSEDFSFPSYLEFYKEFEESLIEEENSDFYFEKYITNFNSVSVRYKEQLSNIIRFVKDFKDTIDNKLLITDSKKILQCLNDIINGKNAERYKILKLLKYDENNDIIRLLDLITNDWIYIRTVVARYMLTSNYKEKSVEAAIVKAESLYSLEFKYFNKLLSLMDK